MKAIFKHFRMLRQDALDRGMLDLAIAYGMAAIKYGDLMLKEQRAALGE